MGAPDRVQHLRAVDVHRLQDALRSRQIMAGRIEGENYAGDAPDDFFWGDGSDVTRVSTVIARVAHHEIMIGRHNERAEVP